MKKIKISGKLNLDKFTSSKLDFSKIIGGNDTINISEDYACSDLTCDDSCTPKVTCNCIEQNTQS